MKGGDLTEDERIIGAMHKFLFRLHRDADAALSKRRANLGQFFTLIAVKRCRNASQVDIANMLSLTPAAVSRMIDGLARTKLVERVADPASRRTKRIRLTKEGTRRLSDLKESVKGIAHTHLAPLSRADRAAFLRMLRALINVPHYNNQ